MDKYIPPFEISNEMLKKVSDIMEKIGKLDSFTNLDKTPYLRKQTKINSVHSSVAIENNPLSLEQVKDVINGKLVIGEQKDIQEVKNAYKAYEMLKDINPYSIDDLKKVHGVMTFLVEEVSGEFRTSSEGVFDDNGNCIFVCPPGDRVNSLMNDLFEWLNENKDTIHPLILSSIFHYEFVFIHPFTNGNGRTVRLWQNSILYKWKDIFEYLPIESKIHKYQDEYYVCNEDHITGKGAPLVCNGVFVKNGIDVTCIGSAFHGLSVTVLKHLTRRILIDTHETNGFLSYRNSKTRGLHRTCQRLGNVKLAQEKVSCCQTHIYQFAQRTRTTGG